MKSIYIFILVIAINSTAQVFDEELYGNLDSPSFFKIYNNENILITNYDTNTVFAGTLGFNSVNSGSVTIKPSNDYSINIIPIPNPSNKIGAGTSIGVKTGGGGLIGKITLYPNPVTSELQLNSTLNITGYKIYNSFGVLKSDSKFINDKSIKAEIKTLLPGIYYILITLENSQTISKQFIKQ